MALSYTTTPFQFVDSINGTASSGNIKNLVPIAVDRMYHKEVQKKNFFATHGMIGADTYREGDATQTAPGFPVIRKTTLAQNPGDTLRVGLRKNLAFTINTGKTGADQLVDNEVGWNFDDIAVRINQLRQAVRTDGGINAQRNPYESFAQTEMSLLSDWHAQVQDTGILYAAFAGFAPHLFRELGTTACDPSIAKHVLYGNDESLTITRTQANLVGTGDDNVNARTFELAATYMEQNDFDPVQIDGDGYWVGLVSPYAVAILMKDDRFRNAMLYAMERGKTNPIFRNVTFLYNNVMIYKYDKIRTVLGGNNPNSLTVGSKSITEVAYAGIGGGVTSSQLHQTLFFGANAVMLAEGQLSRAERVRAEDDYGNIIGRAVDGVWGAQRADFIVPGGGTITNQSLLVNVNTLIP